VKTFALAHRFSQHVLDLPVDAAQLVGSPSFQVRPQLGIDAEQELFALGHRSITQVAVTLRV